jgi:MFS family permease
VSGSTKRWTLVATILGSSIAILDSSVVSVALPSIQRSLGGGLAGQQWVSNAYLLTLGSLILLGGSLATSLESAEYSRWGWVVSARPLCCARLRRRSGCWWRFAPCKA